MKEAMLFEKLENKRVRCNLCAHHCVIAPGKLGVCRVRQNLGGTLVTMAYGRTISQHVDPIEKKPLYHFYPGSSTYSIATIGCNFRCQWCQNWQISQMPREGDLIASSEAPPKHIVANALNNGSLSIAYTYTEPTIFFEYAYDTACLAHQAGLSNIFVTNGYMTQDMLELFHPCLDAANVDLKSFRDETYRRYIGAKLQPVLDTMKIMKELGIWLEVTTLVVPDLNDDPAELRDIARFIVRDLGADTPWHISRFYTGYKMTNRPPTPIETLKRTRDIGYSEGLYHVYLGNVSDEEITRCPQCGNTLIRRSGYLVTEFNITNGHCPDCNAPIAGVWH